MKWITLDNENGTSTLKQHCFIPVEMERRYTGEKYIGNESLCGKVYAGNGNEEVENWTKLNSESQSQSACKICARLSKLNP